MDKPSADSDYDLILRDDVARPLGSTAMDNRALIATAYRAQLDGDLDAWWAIFDPNVRFAEAASLPYGCLHDNLEDTRKAVDAMLGTWSAFHVDIEDLATGHDVVIAYLKMRGTSRTTGRSFAFKATEVFKIKDGRVVEWYPIYWDTHEVRTVVGLS